MIRPSTIRISTHAYHRWRQRISGDGEMSEIKAAVIRSKPPHKKWWRHHGQRMFGYSGESASTT